MTIGTDDRARCAIGGGDASLSRYKVELPEQLLDEHGQVLDWLIGFTFDTLAARHLDLRIVADTAPAPVCSSAGLMC